MKRTILLLIICFLLGYQAIGSKVRDLSDITRTEETSTDDPGKTAPSKANRSDSTQNFNFTIKYEEAIYEINEKKYTTTITLPQKAPKNIEFIAESSDANVLKVSCDKRTITVTPIGEGSATVTIRTKDESTSSRTIGYTVRLPYDSLKAERDSLKAERNSLKAEINSLKRQLINRGPDYVHAPSNKWKFNKLDIILGIIAGLLLIILIIVLVLKKKADAKTLGSQTELQGMIADLENKVQGLTKEKAELESLKSNWEREKRSLEQEITGLRNKKAPVAPIAPSPKPAPPQPQSLYADAIVNGKFNRVKEQPDPAETNFELRLDSPTATSAKIYIYPGAERRILANPAFLEGCDKQILGNSRVETTHPGLATKEGEDNWVVTKKPEVIIR